MESSSEIIIPLIDKLAGNIEKVGSKTKNLNLLINNSFKVPEGFCISTDAYKAFITENKLYNKIEMEISRKKLEDMRWEEMWDASLRIRSAFLKAEIPPYIKDQITEKIKTYPLNLEFSVRSSSPSEDSEKTSFAGIHESYINISGIKDLLKSIKLVWASLWSDRAILYREELELDSYNSSIAVLVQKMEKRPLSGLAFSREPTGLYADQMVIEAVDGLLAQLVDNVKEGEKWVIDRKTHKIISHKKREEYEDSLLNEDEISTIITSILHIENVIGYPVDVEWTGVREDFTILQTRPITSLEDENTERKWYLTLTPNFENLKALADRVENNLIPELIKTGKRLSSEKSENLEKKQLASALKKRALCYFKWKDIYWDEFIPFAHGIRNLGTYYNDLVRPDNPYEFMELLKDSNLIAAQRDVNLKKLADHLNNNSELKLNIKKVISNGLNGKKLIKKLLKLKQEDEVYSKFIKDFIELLDDYMDVAYENQSFKDYPELVLNNIYQLSENPPIYKQKSSGKTLLDKLYRAAGESRKSEVDEVLRIGRLSWKLRDDDNILLGKIESQLLTYMKLAADILIKEGRIENGLELVPEDWKKIYQGLLDDEIKINLTKKEDETTRETPRELKPRQLVGQPSSPGIVTGRARIINSFQDFSKIKSGEILVCDAIQPQMTFLVSIAAGIVERRGGMLVHSSIIAREMGIPAVNGVGDATFLIKNGDMVTVNGYLGLVIIGEPEFNLEHGKYIRETL
ncbi:MAG: PEP/pyruvate-binding domain-containing protein [Methanobacteriaceae archaeon]|nr:PEP/pyruvate-binding domain-containing protein [Methanobacteriaceae archaeon]